MITLMIMITTIVIITIKNNIENSTNNVNDNINNNPNYFHYPISIDTILPTYFWLDCNNNHLSCQMS